MKDEMKLNTKDKYYIHTYTQILVVTFKNKGELQKEAPVQNVKKKKLKLHMYFWVAYFVVFPLSFRFQKYSGVANFYKIISVERSLSNYGMYFLLFPSLSCKYLPPSVLLLSLCHQHRKAQNQFS